MRSRIFLMASTADLSALMTSIESQKAIKYTRTGFPDEPIMQQANSFTQIDGFGISVSGGALSENMFLISEPGLEIKIQPIRQTNGKWKYSIATVLNPKTIRFKVGGLFGGDTVVTSEILVYSDEPEAITLFKLFQATIRKQFKKHKTSGYWIGAEALKMQIAGKLLTDDVRSPLCALIL